MTWEDFSGTVLFIGGPQDGELMMVQDWRSDQTVILAPRPYQVGVDDPSLPIQFTTGLYTRRTIAFFGAQITVHVWDGLPMERVEAHLIQHLLSEAAKAVIHDEVDADFPV